MAMHLRGRWNIRGGMRAVVVSLCIPVIGSSGASLGAPQIDSLSEPVRPPSGRLLLLGSGFGSGQGDGDVLIDHIEAIVTQWADGVIHAYVPESASIGDVDVQVVTADGASNILPLEVTARSPDGRIRWAFEMDRWMTRQFVAVAPGGTIYTADQLGLYALSADGGLLWFHPGAGGVYPIDLAPDGTIYAGRVLNQDTLLIRAINPDGSTLWEFHDPVSGYSLKLGPSVGPDGNIYAAADRDLSPLGAFSLDPQGNLRWQSEGDPELTSTEVPALTASEAVFAGGRLSFGWMHTTPTPRSYTFDLDGNQLWFTGNSDLNVFFHSFPRLDPRGRAIGVWGQTGLIALEPDGDTAWIVVHPSQINVRKTPTVDSRGVVYAGVDRSEMWAVSPDGEILWVLPSMPLTSLSKIAISPDDAVIVAHFWRSGEPTAITGHDPADGAFLWLVELANFNGSVQQVTSLYPRFSGDASTAYVTASAGSTETSASRIYAIDITSAAGHADLDGDGDVDTTDLNILLSDFGCTAPPCAGDADGDGDTDTTDLNIVLSMFGSVGG